MLMTERQRKNRASRLKKETTDIAAGLGIVIFSIVVFINPDKKQMDIFPGRNSANGSRYQEQLYGR